jgi:hypothetical protein
VTFTRIGHQFIFLPSFVSRLPSSTFCSLSQASSTFLELKQVTDLPHSAVEVVRNATEGIEFDDIKLIGGASQMPCIVSALRAVFKRSIESTLDADEAIAVGAGYGQGNATFQINEEGQPLGVKLTTIVDEKDFEICRPRQSCIPSVRFPGIMRNVDLNYFDGPLHPGVTDNSGLLKLSMNVVGNKTVSFGSRPFRIEKVERCNATCLPGKFAPCQKPTFSKDMIVLYSDPDARAFYLNKTRTELEDFSSRVLDEIAKNRTVRTFSNHTQRLDIIRCAEKQKKWLKADPKITTFKNYSEHKRELMICVAPLYRRIEENQTFWDIAERIYKLIQHGGQLREQMRAKDEPKDEQLRFVQRHLKMEEWFNQTLEKIERNPLWMPLPVKIKVMRDKFVFSPPLFRSFFLFSQVRIDPSLLDEIRAQFDEDPVLFRLSEDYICRVVTDKTRGEKEVPDICSLFCPKTSFLRQMLIDVNLDRLSLGEVNLLMLICFSHLEELEKPSKMFYFFRILRECFSKVEQAQLRTLYESIRSEGTFIVEQLSPILDQELALFHPFHRSFYLEYLRTERLPKMEIPSWLMAELKTYPANGISFGAFKRSVANPVFAMRLLDTVSAHREWISQLEFYSELLFDERSPLLSVVDASFLKTLLAHHHETQRLARFIERLRSFYFSIPDGIRFIAQSYGNEAPSLVASYCIENFARDLSLASAKQLAEFLARISRKAMQSN